MSAIAHTIGITAFNPYTPPSESFSAMTRAFGYGCLLI